MLETIDLTTGTHCFYQGREVCLRRMLDLQTMLGQYEATGALVVLPIKDLRPLVAHPDKQEDSFLHVADAAYAKAQQKLEMLKPLLQEYPSAALIKKVAKEVGKGYSTLRRWLRLYQQSGSVLALVEKVHPGGKGKSRLAPEKEALVQKVIQEHFLTRQSKSPAHVYEEVKRAFNRAGYDGNLKTPPTDKTLRNRLQALAPRLQEEKRGGARAAKERFDPVRATTLEAPHPLALVQLDHALLNIVLVHEKSRQQMSRPWLTIATDVFSRMVVGFHLAFEEPGAGGTGLCLAHAILPKETWLSERKITGEWPCWGVMETLHLDNAREFHGTMLQRASERYGITLRYRPPKRPEYGGHIERLIRTIKFHVRRLAGSLITPRRGRRLVMPQKAAFSLPEFERWLTTYLVNVYHHQEHKSLGMSPYERYQQGILGSAGQPGIGPRPRIQDKLQVERDFMPFVERSIQRYGVLVDHLHYYTEVLRSFIGQTSKAADNKPQRFIFKRDPRDLRYLYFLHPVTRQYLPVPLANMRQSAFSLWEYRQVIRRELVRKPAKEQLTAKRIFAGLDELEAIERDAVLRTNKMTKAARRLLEIVPKSKVAKTAVSPPLLSVAAAPPATVDAAPALSPLTPSFPNVEPFSELDDGTPDF